MSFPCRRESSADLPSFLNQGLSFPRRREVVIPAQAGIHISPLINMIDNEAIQFLKSLVETPSLSGEEATAVSLLVNKMAEMDFSAYIDEAGNGVGIRENPDVNGEINNEIVLLGHIDTVPGEIAVRIKDGKLYGRGSVDAKGPLATFLFAAARAEIQPGTRLVVIGAVEEECATSKGARHAAASFNPDYCIIGEPSGWDGLTLGYKGRLLVDYHLRQPMGHTAGPQTGVAEQAIAWWNKLKAYVDQYNSGRKGLFKQILPSLRDIHTQSDGIHNTVQAKIGLRLPPDFDLESFREEVTEWAGDAQLSFHGFEPAFQTSRRSPLVAIFNQVFRANNIRPHLKLKTGTSDMNVVGPIWNYPIAAYGPGGSSLDHTPEEHIEVGDYLRAIGLLSDVLFRLSRL
jgi:LysW-gamma-L-lysine carboxypeptidase